MTFEEEKEEDEELDPLKSSATREEHLDGGGGGGGGVWGEGESGGTSQQAELLATDKGLLGDLAGLDLSAREHHPPASHAGTNLADILQPLQSSQTAPLSVSAPQTFIPPVQPSVATLPSQFPGGVVSMPGSAVPVAYAVLPGGRGGGGGKMALGQQVSGQKL